ncbi:MAG TPA: hypothetical protein VF282_08470 [Bacillota bacterium]
MPYIEPDQRPAIDEAIHRTAEAIRRQGADLHARAGLINYAVTRLVLELIADEPRLRYHHIALVTGVLENVKQEFYRRLASPYEDGKAAENGDVYPGRAATGQG